MNLKSAIEKAEKRIRPYVRNTYCIASPQFSQLTGCHVYFKLENLQHTGSFKVRGAMNKLLSLTEEQKKRGIITASSGNHGAAIAYALAQFNMEGLIVVPENASPTKIALIKSYGGNVQFHGTDTGMTESFAKDYATKNNMEYLSPYNDFTIIAGQGTIAVEMFKQLNNIDAVFVSIGGGGLMSGNAAYCKAVNPNTKIIGSSPINSPVLIQSIKAGKIIDLKSKPTLSDATAGGVEHDTITFELCRQYVDNYDLVTEDEIKAAIVKFIEAERMLIEGSAGVAIASLLKRAGEFQGKNVVVIICGANISLETLKTIVLQKNIL